MSDANNNLPTSDPNDSGSSPGTASPDEQGDELIAKIVSALPSQVRAMAMEAPAWQVPPDCLAMGALAHLALALGNSQRVLLPGLQRPAAFSLVMVADHSPGPGSRWLDLLGEPWLSPAQQLEFHHAAMGAKATQAEVDRLVVDAKEVGGIANAQVTKAVLVQAMRLNQPVAKRASACPKRLAEAMEASFDRAVVSLNGGVDPARELIGSATRAPAKLATLLANSWQRHPLTTGEGIPVQGSLTLLWQTTRHELRPLLFGPSRPWSHTTPPVVFIRQRGRPAWFPDRETPAFKGWAGLLGTFFQLRCASMDVSLWHLPAEAWPLLEALSREVIDAGDKYSGLRRFIIWMPELAIPLAMVLTLAKGEALNQPRGEGQGNIVSMESMTGAIAIVRWLVEQQLATLEWIRSGEVSAELEASMANGTDKMDVETVMEMIPRTLQRRGPLTPVEILRSFHKLDADTRDIALKRLVALGQIGKMATGDWNGQLRPESGADSQLQRHDLEYVAISSRRCH